MKRRRCRVLSMTLLVILCAAFILTPGYNTAATCPSRRVVTVIYTTDTLGYLEPCGCGGRIIGGLPKRASYIKSVLTENPNCVIVESGNLAYRSDPGQPTAQLETVVQALKYMGYTATGVGSIDVRLGNEFYDVLERNALPVVHIDEVKQDRAQPYLVKDVNGIRVGIISFGAVEPDRKDKLSLFRRRYQAFKEARQMSDVLIVLDQAELVTDDWLLRNTGRLGAPDIVVKESTDPNPAEPRQVGDVLLVPAGKQGMYVGRVDIEITADGKKMVFSRAAMDETVSDDPVVLEMVKSYVAEQRKLMQLQVISNSRSEQSANASNPRTTVTHIETGGAYYNYQACANCHESEYSHWKQTRHAKALDTLVAADKTIADCLPCHSEMYRRTTSVVTDPELSLGVECASCHYDVLPHSADFKKKGDTEAVKAKCGDCHTRERSPNFDPITAYETVKHPQK